MYATYILSDPPRVVHYGYANLSSMDCLYLVYNHVTIAYNEVEVDPASVLKILLCGIQIDVGDAPHHAGASQDCQN